MYLYVAFLYKLLTFGIRFLYQNTYKKKKTQKKIHTTSFK